MSRELKTILALAALVLAAWFLPVGSARFDASLIEAFAMLNEYARLHILLCLVPALFIAGAIGVFLNRDSVLSYLGPGANRLKAYGVASVSGTILAVCSCTVLPIFAGIYSMGAGLGPAAAFLYSGPAINILAIVMTARVLGVEIGVARAVGAVVFSIVIGLLMSLFFRKSKSEIARTGTAGGHSAPSRPLWRTVLFFASMVGILVFANWGSPEGAAPLWVFIARIKWWIASASALLLALILAVDFGAGWRKVALWGIPVAVIAVLLPGKPVYAFTAGVVAVGFLSATGGPQLREWFDATLGFARQIIPLLLGGVLVAGFLLGRPGHEAMIPSSWIAGLVGGNSIPANLFASASGALMYFATLTEVPILQGLMGSGMGNGPALALLLAGPTLSLPSMLVLRSIMGLRKTMVYVALVVVLSTVTGLIYGSIAG
ncbi:MAG TPA: permease [Candidatus Fermentibacter sp.]|nr:permease [Candidatus Fermentibacter sp.]